MWTGVEEHGFLSVKELVRNVVVKVLMDKSWQEVLCTVVQRYDLRPRCFHSVCLC